MSRGGSGSSGRAGNWVVTLLGASVLAVVGFGVGMLAGGLWEAPDLVFHYLSGGTEEVALATPESDAARRLAGSEPQTREATGNAAGEPEVTSAPDPSNQASPEPSARLPAVAAPAPRLPGRIAVQVGAFAESRAAEKLASGLRARGYPVYLSPGASSGDARWRVRVGPLASQEEARQTASRLKTEEKLPTWVVSEDG